MLQESRPLALYGGCQRFVRPFAGHHVAHGTQTTGRFLQAQTTGPAVAYEGQNLLEKPGAAHKIRVEVTQPLTGEGGAIGKQIGHVEASVGPDQLERAALEGDKQALLSAAPSNQLEREFVERVTRQVLLGRGRHQGAIADDLPEFVAYQQTGERRRLVPRRLEGKVGGTLRLCGRQGVVPGFH